MTDVGKKIKIGISSCLIGDRVRYDGGHKYDRELLGALGEDFELVPVCPEAGCGMTIPRYPLRLEGTLGNLRIVTPRTRLDHSERMRAWGIERLAEFECEGICGYVFKSKSPSCGLRDVEITGTGGEVDHTGAGFWASMFMLHFPSMPVEDETRLHDPAVRDDFMSRIYACNKKNNMI